MSEMDFITEMHAPVAEGATPTVAAAAAAAPSPAADPTAHARERNRRLVSSVTTAIPVKLLGLLTPLVTVPLFVKYLGRDRYGLFETIVAMSQLLAITNGGLTMGLVNRLMDCHVAGDRAKAQRYVSSLAGMLGAISIIAVILWTAASIAVPWPRIFRTTDPQSIREMPWVVWITGISVVGGLVFTLPVAIYQAYQELTAANLWDAVAKIATFIACFIVIYTTWGLIGVALATTAVQTVVAVITTFWLFRRKPWIRPRLSCFDRKLVRAVLTDGLLLFLIQAAVVLLYSCDKLVIGAGISPAANTQYSLLGRLFLYAYAVFMVLLTPLWPAHGEALRRGEWAWIRRGLRLSLVIGIGICAAGGVVLLLFGNTIFRIWTRGQVTQISPNLVLAMTSMFVLRAWVDCRSVILTSANVLLPQVVFFGAHAVVNLVVAIILCRFFGVAGVAWATPITALFTSAWGYPWMLRREAAKYRQSNV